MNKKEFEAKIVKIGFYKPPKEVFKKRGWASNKDMFFYDFDDSYISIDTDNPGYGGVRTVRIEYFDRLAISRNKSEAYFQGTNASTAYDEAWKYLCD